MRLQIRYMIKMVSRVISLLAIVLSCSCDNGIKKPVVITKELNDWGKDRDGCMKLRSKELAKKLIKEYQLMHKTKSDFINVFKEPNSLKKDGDKTVVLTYYFDAICDNDKIIEGSDRCYANFYFTNDKFLSEEFICE